MPYHVLTNPDGTGAVALDYSDWCAELRQTAIAILQNQHAWRYRQDMDCFELVDADLEGLNSMDQFRVLGGIGLELLTKAVCLKRRIDILRLQTEAVRKSYYAMYLVHADKNPWLQTMFARYRVRTVADLRTCSFGDCIGALQRSTVASGPKVDALMKSLDRWRAFNRNMDCHILHPILAMEEYEVKLPSAINGLLRIYAES
jgi:hypothetical protein